VNAPQCYGVRTLLLLLMHGFQMHSVGDINRLGTSVVVTFRGTNHTSESCRVCNPFPVDKQQFFMYDSYMAEPTIALLVESKSFFYI
jgi:hypothetical protein